MTPQQLAIIKADIEANPDLSSQPLTNLGSVAIASLYNALSATDVWRTDAPVQAIYDAIDWSKFTPLEAADGTVIYTNRMLNIQTKQMNLQNMLQGRSTVNASKVNLRAGLRDAVTALPAGASGASVAAGGASGVLVLAACIRKATRFEKLFATVDSTTGNNTAKLLVIEGSVSADTIQQARES